MQYGLQTVLLNTQCIEMQSGVRASPFQCTESIKMNSLKKNPFDTTQINNYKVLQNYNTVKTFRLVIRDSAYIEW